MVGMLLDICVCVCMCELPFSLHSFFVVVDMLLIALIALALERSHSLLDFSAKMG